ncbi:hypothetical protein [Methanolobus psychrotolerans]|uniref:hypothetical protein n=1 Tax=Methanolobus psychrotolerans TaxID=1874706 RepID=UPI000B919CDE|nr:hypothetical protein [Methanolobus psychrotolerans]
MHTWFWCFFHAKVIHFYINKYFVESQHKSKFNGEAGILERKHVKAESIVYIGKEANNIDEQVLDVKKAQEFINKQEIMDSILNLSVSEAKELGVSKTTLWDMHRIIRETGELNLNTQAVKKLTYSSISES